MKDFTKEELHIVEVEFYDTEPDVVVGCFETSADLEEKFGVCDEMERKTFHAYYNIEDKSVDILYTYTEFGERDIVEYAPTESEKNIIVNMIESYLKD